MIVVLVILALIAAVAIAGYSAVVDKSEDAAAEATARSVEGEMRALMAFDAGSTEDGTEDSLQRAFITVQQDLPSNVQLTTVGGDRPSHLSCGEDVVVLRSGQRAGKFTPDCLTVTPGDSNDMVRYTRSWMTSFGNGDGALVDDNGDEIAAGSGVLQVQPSVPQNVTITAPAFEEFRLTFDAPADDGGAAITGYEYQLTLDGNAGVWTPMSGTDVLIAASGGVVSAEIAVRAVNSAGTSTIASASVAIPQFYPDAPTAVSVSADGPGMFSYTVAAAHVPNNGPSVSYEYRYSLDGGPWSGWADGGAATSGSFTTTVANTSIDFEIRARNAAGFSDGITVSETVPAFTPLAPTSVTADAVGVGILVDYTIVENTVPGVDPTSDWQYQVRVADQTTGNWPSWPTGWESTGSAALTGQITLSGLAYYDIYELRFRGVNTHGAGPSTGTVDTVEDFTPDEVEFIVVAAGGGGGRDGNYGGAGGGAGGYISSVDGEKSGRNTSPVADLIPVAGTSYDVVVGAGGSSPSNAARGNNGSPSQLASVIAYGGGGGGRTSCSSPYSGASGGSGGGGGGEIRPYGCTSGVGKPGGSGTSGQGYGGGHGGYCGGRGGGAAGGGGGAMGSGSNGGCSTGTGGAGGAGAVSSITGSAGTYAAGGRGGYGGAYSGGCSANTGSGGDHRKPGCSGVVIIRFDDSKGVPTISSGLTYTVTQAAGYTVVTFTAGSGTIMW